MKKNLKIPKILFETKELFQKIYINVPEQVILNILIAKTAQMFTSKRVQFDESGRINIPNWFAMLFIASGGGKDKLIRDLDNLVFKDFNNWFKSRAEELYSKQMNEFLGNTNKEKNIKETQKGEEKENVKSQNPF